MTKILIAAMVLTLTPFGVARAQQKTIEQRLAEALENAKKGLVKAIPFLRRYLDDPNDRVKSSVFNAVA